MARDFKGSWLDQVAELLRGKERRLRRPIRRLVAEKLERRNVLCQATAAAAPDALADAGDALAALYERAAIMGPVLPAATGQAGDGNSAATTESNASDSPWTMSDWYFAGYGPQGEGSGGGQGSGSGSGGGSGSGACSGSGSGGGECSGSGSGAGEGSGSGSGEGSGSGSGSGQGSGSGNGSGSGQGSGSGSGAGSGSGSGSGGAQGSGSGGEGDNQAPSVSVSWFVVDGMLYLTGQVSDDGDISELLVSFGELINITVSVDENGQFSVQIPCPEDQGSISYSVTDGEGLSSETGYFEYTP